MMETERDESPLVAKLVSDPVVEPDIGSLNLVDSIQKLCLTEDMSDVVFIFPNENNKKLPAHKFVLSARSSVFRTMFYGSMPEKGDVSLPNVSVKIFDEFLKYLYTDRLEVSSTTVTELLYISHKYGVACLIKLCEEYLEENLGVDNVCTVLAQASFFSLENLKSEALIYVEFNAKEVLQSSDFESLPRECLSTLLDSKMMKATEAEIIAAVLRWVDFQCTIPTQEQKNTDKRAILGNLLYKLRIPCLSLSEFSETLAETGILTDAEELQFYRYFSKKSKTDEILKFPETPRGEDFPIRLEIMKYFQEGQSNYMKDAQELLNFTCKKDSPVKLCEIGFFGSTEPSKNFDRSRCKYEHKLFRIKIRGLKGDKEWQDILETKRSERLGNVKMNIVFEPSQPYTLEISIKTFCECCGYQPPLSLRQVPSQATVVGGRMRSTTFFYPTKTISAGLHLQLEGTHIVKALTITNS